MGGKKRHKEKKKTRSEVIIVSKEEDISHIDIFRKVKSDQELKDLGASVSRIRRTQKGDLLLEQDKSSEKITYSSRGQVEKVLGEQVPGTKSCLKPS